MPFCLCSEFNEVAGWKAPLRVKTTRSLPGMLNGYDIYLCIYLYLFTHTHEKIVFTLVSAALRENEILTRRYLIRRGSFAFTPPLSEVRTRPTLVSSFDRTRVLSGCRCSVGSTSTRATIGD